MTILSYNRSSKLKNSLQNIELLRRKILLTPLSPKAELRLRWKTTINRIYFNFRLSGSSIEKQHIVRILTSFSKNRPTKIEQEAINVRKLFDYLSSEWLASKESISLKTIVALYEILFEDVFQKKLDYISGPPEQSIKSLLTYVQTGSENPVIQAGTAFILFAQISPFPQRNETIGRFLAYVFLYKFGYDFRGLLVPEEEWYRDRINFNLALQNGKKQTNATLWLEYFSESMVRHLEDINKQMTDPSSPVDMPSTFWDLNDRQKKILQMLESPQEIITNKKVQKFFKISQITASRDLAKLTTLGLLFIRGKGRSIHYVKV